jgi:putative hydrolase of the HAD superfamily
MSGFSSPQANGPAAAEGPDFRHVRHWVFDLDNTLYRADNGIFARIDARMTEFVAYYLDMDREDARRLQKALYREHGTTLNGLIKLYGMDPEPYLDFVHRIELSDLQCDAALGFAIERLPGRHYVFTNGCANHAARILERLGFAHLFADVWDIRTSGFVPKPDPFAYHRALAKGGFPAREGAMFDDIARNLVSAHGLGMTTVWLNTESGWDCQGPEFPVASAGHIDHETRDLTQFLNTIRI